MRTPIYQLIIFLMATSAIGMIILQSIFLYKQYKQNQTDFDRDVQRAVAVTANVYSAWNSHTSTEENANSYNALYTNADSTFIFMIAQTAQNYPLLDFKPDTLLPKLRKKQFLRFKDELERTRRKENKSIQEFYLFRTIQYCANCNEKNLSIAQIFPLDSLLRNQLIINNIRTEPKIGFYHTGSKNYTFLSSQADTISLNRTPYTYNFTKEEQLRFYFPEKNKLITNALVLPIVASIGLVVVSLCSFWLALRVIFRQKKLSDMKNDFINNVTHEFKTPISTIAFAVANIENEHTIHQPMAIRQFTKVIKDENKRLNAQVEKVLQAAITENAAFELKREPLNIHLIINELADAYDLKIKDKGTIHRKLNAAQAQVMGDTFHISNAISNLLDNALKYSAVNIDIIIYTESNEKGIFIKIEDNGIGIGKENQALIFDKFYRIYNGNLHNVKGFGLGLSYVKEIVERHDGTINVHSKLNVGSIFSVYFPFE